MREKIRIVMSCIITCLLTCIILAKLTDLMERKSSDYKYADFFEQTEDFDVLFMGTSHVINAVYPMELWDKQGIVSYNFGGHSNQMATTYWTLRNALDYTTPKLVVIDCYTLASNWKCSDLFSYVHLSLDTFPLSLTKVRAVYDLLDDSYLESAIEDGTARQSEEPRTKIGLLWDYSVYHNRWNEIEYNDFYPSKNIEKGAESRIAITRRDFQNVNTNQKMEPGTVGEEYLRKMIQECQERGIAVLLTYLPIPAGDDKWMEANYVADIAGEYGINYINFLDLNVVDFQTDLYDYSSHLNPSGARKVTEYLGEYIVQNYDIENQKDNSAYAFWKQDYDTYQNFKDNALRKQEDLSTYLMLLSGDNVDVEFNFHNKNICQNEWIMKLINNLGVDPASYLNGEENNALSIIVRRNSEIVDEVEFDYTIDPLSMDIQQISCTRATDEE